MSTTPFWTPEKEQFVKYNYEKMTALQMAEKLGCRRSRVKNRIRVLGLLKSHNPGKYTSGHAPANKGKAMSKETKEKLKHTFFPKGNKPHNTKYDGHERINEDGYILIRISKGKYVLKHRFIWERKNGPIPDGYCLSFKDGDRLNIDLSNLELITHKQNALNNQLSDGYIASKLAAKTGVGRGKYDKDLKTELLKHPELIELKRNQLKLQQQLKQKK